MTRLEEKKPWPLWILIDADQTRIKTKKAKVRAGRTVTAKKSAPTVTE